MDKQRKAEIIAKYGRKEGDTGSPEVQIALLTERINHLNEHLKINKKDNHSPSRPSENGRCPSRSPGLPEEDRPRGLQKAHC